MSEDADKEWEYVINFVASTGEPKFEELAAHCKELRSELYALKSVAETKIDYKDASIDYVWILESINSLLSKRPSDYEVSGD